ncbi:YaiI/YqxD family protein [Hyphomicrobium sp. LHD-15]|uniref:YaiI/YqxD family protein n=1 Tax=Hyphomicrobium sp. LHD-15 TaxID=3072142 RepID=UPI00280D4A55|nr:YaiI/YqxD family protein [Hyphomicrobium sp. LHD-15]MDQ8699421.1 YaiI/YqxD family protein [Hyphomicrobium sp. LHD-15]
MTVIYVDADACPVKDEVQRVAGRHDLAIVYVSNAWMRLPEGLKVERIIVPDGPDAADDWIASRIGKGDIAVTADIPLAARCLKAGAQALGPTGKPFTDASIGMALAMRDLSKHLRETGESRGLNASFTRQDRSQFLEALELAVQRAKRG